MKLKLFAYKGESLFLDTHKWIDPADSSVLIDNVGNQYKVASCEICNCYIGVWYSANDDQFYADELGFTCAEYLMRQIIE